ncbi:MAG: NAD(P)H-quinone oxidoreductase [Burkholderiaceae bacterium]|nr:NAD(P)H-quinone oxidoreductase [Burkholderiaceae bacterium]
MQIPKKIRYVSHGEGGPPSVLAIAEGATPAAAAGEVLIRVAWAGVNRPDLLQRSGSYPPPPGASPWLGLEVSGEVVALGEGASGHALGDSVCALCNGGGYAEYVAVPAGQVLPVPRGMSLRDAATLPETMFTVWTNVFERGRLVAGETLLVHGGSSGIGLTAIQLAHDRGATVYATVGSAEKASACKGFGADAVINYREQDFVEEVGRLSGGRGVNLILDMVGGDYVARNLRCLALEGRLVQIAFLKSPKVEIDLLPVLIKRLTYTGSTLRPRSAAEKAAIAGALHAQVWPRIEAGAIRASVFREFDLADAAAAHELMESSTHIGKLVMRVAGG